MFKGDQFSGSDPDSTAQILFLMKEIYGEDDVVWLKGVKLFEKFLDKVTVDVERGYYVASNGEKRENGIYHLTYLLLSSLVDSKRRIEAGYDLKDVRVNKIVQAILKSQRENGGWRPFWIQDSDPTYTVLALKLLIWLGAPEARGVEETGCNLHLTEDLANPKEMIDISPCNNLLSVNLKLSE